MESCATEILCELEEVSNSLVVKNNSGCNLHVNNKLVAH